MSNSEVKMKVGESSGSDAPLKAAVKRRMLEDFHHSAVVEHVKAGGFSLCQGRVALHMARELGFCYGVERTVQHAYETLERYRESDVYITDEIIHNPQVNQRLISLGMKFLRGRFGCGKRIEDLGPGDVVLIPAFGVPAGEMKELRGRGSVVVDTTCGSVLNVWRKVERYAREGFSAVVHGKYAHEETRATVSQVGKYPGGKYIVVRDLDEAEALAAYVRRGGDRAEFLRHFEKAVSPGFDPDRDLARIGLANQTTMMSSESLEVQGILRRAMVDRYGEAGLDGRFLAFDTICSATQNRQETALEMLRTRRLDLCLVVGGYNSSNTGHLAEIAAAFTPAYHVEDETSLVSEREIRYLCTRKGDVVRADGWLPSGEVSVGITAGASTPDDIVGRVIQRLYDLAGSPLEGRFFEARGSAAGDLAFCKSPAGMDRIGQGTLE